MGQLPEFPQGMVPDLVDGDHGAFDRLYRTYRARIYGNIRKMVKSEDVAEELLQETFVRVWQKRADLDPGQPVRPYLFRIAGNLVTDFFRRAARDRRLEERLAVFATAHYRHIEERIYHKETRGLLEKAIATLPPQRARVFRLVKLEGKSYDEVARELGISKSTINNHIVKATHSVKEYLINSGDIILVMLLMFGGGEA